MTSMPARLASLLRWSGGSRGAALFVWGVWAGMVAIAIWHFAHFARNMPMARGLVACCRDDRARAGPGQLVVEPDQRAPASPSRLGHCLRFSR